MKPFVPSLLLSLALLGASPAFAHGEEAHAKKAGPVVKEQKAWGIAGDAKAVKRTIAIAMGDNMRFTPARIEVNQGDTVRLTLSNTGKVMHELVIGTQKELAEHAELMKRFPNMEHEEPYMAHVPPGKTGEIIWTFNRPGTFDFACLLPGHFEAGMVGKIVVSAMNGNPK
ncbi:MAG: cupredoxin family protein [Hydrogenophaga sp.]